MHRTLRITVTATALTAALGLAAPARAAGSRQGGLFPLGLTTAAAAGDEGHTSDPDGARAAGDAGLTSDPDGSSTTGDLGATMDPDG